MAENTEDKPLSELTTDELRAEGWKTIEELAKEGFANPKKSNKSYNSLLQNISDAVEEFVVERFHAIERLIFSDPQNESVTRNEERASHVAALLDIHFSKELPDIGQIINPAAIAAMVREGYLEQEKHKDVEAKDTEKPAIAKREPVAPKSIKPDSPDIQQRKGRSLE